MHTRFARVLGPAVAVIVLTALGLGGAANAASASPQGATTGDTAQPVTAYVANLGSRTVIPIRGTTAGSPIFTGHSARAIAITPNGKTVYVVDNYTGTVTPISTATNTAGPPITTGSGPNTIAITPDGKTAYVPNLDSGTVTPIHTATNTAGPPITTGDGPYAIAITPDGKTAYVANRRGVAAR